MQDWTWVLHKGLSPKRVWNLSPAQVPVLYKSQSGFYAIFCPTEEQDLVKDKKGSRAILITYVLPKSQGGDLRSIFWVLHKSQVGFMQYFALQKSKIW